MNFRPTYLIILYLILGFVFLIWPVSKSTLLLAEENGLLENIQMGLLSLSTFFFFYGAILNHGAVKSSSILLGGLCLLAFFRELELRWLSGPRWLVELAWGPARDIILVFIACTLAIYFFARRQDISNWFKLLFRNESWPLILGGFFLLVAVAADSFKIQGLYGQFFEEMMELDCYLLLMVASIWHSKLGEGTNFPKWSPTKRRPWIRDPR